MKLDFGGGAGANSTVSGESAAAAAAIQHSVAGDVDELFKRWCAEETTQVFVRELLAAAGAGRQV